MFCQKIIFVFILFEFYEIQIKTFIYKVQITHFAFLFSSYQKVRVQMEGNAK